MEAMSKDEILRFLSQARLGHLALADDGAAYAFPIYYAYDGRDFYFHSRPGLKDEFLDATRQACLVVTVATTSDLWESVIAAGKIERISGQAALLAAQDALMRVPLPPEWGYSGPGVPRRSDTTYFLRLRPAWITGRKSTPVVQVSGQETA